MHENSGNSVIYYAHYTTDGVGTTGLTVTITVYEVVRDGTKTEVVTDGACTEIGDGLYRYLLASGTVDAAAEYVAVFHTATDTVDAQDIPAMWVIDRAGSEKLDTGVTLADDAITAAAVKADAVTKIQNGLATPTNITAGTITTVTNLTNLPTMPTDWLTAAGLKADAVTKLQANLALEATLTAIKGVGWSTETLAAIDVLIDAIKAKTDLIPATPAVADEYDAALAAIKAETALIVEDTGTTIPATITTIDDEIAVIDANVDAVLDDTGTTGVLLSTSALTSIFDDETIVGSHTFSDLLKIMAAALAGKVTGGGTTTVTFRGVDDTSDVIVATVDASGNRSAVTLTV